MTPEPAQDAKGSEWDAMRRENATLKAENKRLERLLATGRRATEIAEMFFPPPLRLVQPPIPKGAVTVTCPVCGLKIVIPEKSTANNVRLIKNRHREASRSCAQVLSRQTRRKW